MKSVVIIISFLFLVACKPKSEYLFLNGTAFGTKFTITYKDVSQRDFSQKIDSLIKRVNKSLSTYDKTSDISKINKGDSTIVVDEKFKEVFKKSKRIYLETNGVFDPTIGSLVNAWNFGPEKKTYELDSAKVKELMHLVGFNKVRLQNNKISKQHTKTYFDFNAIAKGYGIDIIGRFFEKNNITDYMIEIGGDVRVRGKSPSAKNWKIGIEQPNFDGTQSVQKIIALQNESMATSGTYRKFKIAKNGTKYAHIIDTKTGYPAKSNILSASVIASIDCADVDGYATVLVALGLEKSKLFLEKHPELKAFLIYSDIKGEMQIFKTKNIE